MANYTLTASSPLAGLQQEYQGVTLAEVTNKALVSISVPLGGETALQTAVTATYGVTLPVTGKSSKTSVDNALFAGMSRDQCWLFFETDNIRPVNIITEKLGASGYYTDQSDSWVMLSLAGEKSRDVLERICPINLDPDVFLIGDVARTSMEHMGSIILRESEHNYLFCSARSSANAFAHAIELSIKNVI